MKVLLIIPAFNEEKNIERVVLSVTNYAAEAIGYTLDYIVVNDGSTDKTGEICKKSNIKCIQSVHNLGIGGAVQTGYQYARSKGYDIAVQFDGDGQHDINSLDTLLAPLVRNECDFVIGSRFAGKNNTFKSTFMRRIGIRFLSLLMWLCAGIKILDTTSGYRAANKEVIAFFAEQYPVDYPEPESLVLLLKHSFRIAETPVNMFERTEGLSSISTWKSVYYMCKVSLAVLCTSFQRRA